MEDKKSKKGLKIFFITLSVAFVLLMCIFLLFFLFGSFGISEQANVNQDEVPYVIDYIPKSQENINILIIASEEIELTPSMFMVFKYDAINAEISLVPLVNDTVLNKGVKKTTIQKEYDYEGIHGATKAVETLLLCEIDRYIRVNSQGVANLIDYLGGVKYDFTEGINCKDIWFTEGKQLLDGRRVASIICNQDDLYIKADVLKTFFSQHFNKDLEYNKFASAIFYNVETNLNQYDFAMRQKGAIAAMGNETLSIILSELNGEYNQYDEFIANKESLEQVINSFKTEVS